MLASEVIEKIEANKGKWEFLKTGFYSLDDALDGGFLRKELVILGGFTGIGKSYMAGQILLNIAKQGFKSSYYSLEISNEMVVSRLIGSLANIRPTRIMAGLLTEEEYQKKLEAKAQLLCFDKYLAFYDSFYQLNQIRKSIDDDKPEFVVIDFIQNIFTVGASEYERLSFASLELQRIAKEQNCCILTLSQLSNRAAREGSDSPTVEYKGSGGISQVADLGFWMEQRDTNKVRLVLRKNRRGQSKFTFDLTFENPGGRIY